MKKIYAFILAFVFVSTCVVAQKSVMVNPSFQNSRHNRIAAQSMPSSHHQAPKSVVTDTLHVIEADYYGQDYLEVTGSQVEVDFYFGTGNVSLDEEFNPTGTGYLLLMYVIAPSVNSALFPAAGNYVVSSTYDPNTIVQGYDVYASIGYPGYGYDGTLLYTIEDGSVVSIEPVASGSATIAGTESNANMTMNFVTDSGTVAEFTFSGDVMVYDLTEQPEDAYSVEPIIPQTVTINSNRIETEVYDGFFYLDVYDATSGYVANMVCYTPSNGSIYGTYTVGADPSDETPGTILYSAGYEGYELYMSFVTGYDDEGYVDLDHYNVFFITDGTLTLSQSDGYINVQGTLGSYFGSTINITGSAVGIESVKTAEVNLFPNPATTQLNVTAEGVKSIQVVDLNGRIVMERPQAGMLDVSTLEKGVYMVRTLTERGVDVQKFVKR